MVAEKLVSLCTSCKCCLAKSSHCWTCHTGKSIRDLCGCGSCEEKLADYQAREEMLRNKRLSKLGRL